MSETVTGTSVRTGLYIGGEERFTDDVMSIPDPGKPGVVVGEAAAASPADVTDAVAAAKAAFPAWSALSPQERARQMTEAIAGIADERDADAAILSQENGKIRLEAWIDALVFELRWNLALMLADEVDTGKTLPPVPGAIPVSTDVSYQPLGVVTVIVPFNWPIAILGASLPHALARKYPGAPREFAWQYVFPSGRRSIDPRDGVERRHHFDDGVLSRALKAACRRAGSAEDDRPGAVEEDAALGRPADGAG